MCNDIRIGDTVSPTRQYLRELGTMTDFIGTAIKVCHRQCESDLIHVELCNGDIKHISASWVTKANPLPIRRCNHMCCRMCCK